MMESFSPLSRRIVALGLLALLVLLALKAAATLAGGLSGSLEELEDSRFRLAKLEAIRARPLPPRPPAPPQHLYFTAGSHGEVVAQVQGLLNGAAASTNLALTRVSPLPQMPHDPALVQVALSAQGPELSLLEFIAQIENGSPAVRLRDWRIAVGASGAAAPGAAAPVAASELRLEAMAVAAWGGRQ